MRSSRWNRKLRLLKREIKEGMLRGINLDLKRVPKITVKEARVRKRLEMKMETITKKRKPKKMKKKTTMMMMKILRMESSM